MDRFLVFSFYRYEPDGGWNDFVSSHAYQYEAEAVARAVIVTGTAAHLAAHVVDTTIRGEYPEDSIVFRIDDDDEWKKE